MEWFLCFHAKIPRRSTSTCVKAPIKSPHKLSKEIYKINQIYFPINIYSV